MALLNFAAYARHRGVTPAAVTKAVAEGRISTEVDPRTGRRAIDPAKADQEWAASTNSAKQEGSKAYRNQRSGASPAPEPDQENHPDAAPPSASTPIPTPSAVLAKSRAMREQYNALRAKLAYERESGKLVEADDVKRQAFATARIVRESMLNIPDRMAAVLAGETDAQRIHSLLTEEITRALEAVADG